MIEVCPRAAIGIRPRTISLITKGDYHIHSGRA